MKFEAFGLCRDVLDNLQALGYSRPTDIQYKSMRPILEGSDILAIAQTGTGKTAAFGIPVIERLLRMRRPQGYEGARCVVMEPTHELAHQTAGVLQGIAKGLGLKIVAVYGGVDQAPQIAGLKKGADIVVATPGRLFDMVNQGYLRTHKADFLVLDEADRMLDMGFIDDIRQMTRYLPRRRQTLFFSATIDKNIKELAYSLVFKPVRIEISRNKVAKNVTHTVLNVSMDDKRFYLERVVRENPESRIMVFVRTKVRAERVKAAMKRVSIEAVTMHGDLDQRQRQQALDDFRQRRVPMLISTDVAARGIDIPGVDYVVNYDVPEVPENYVHRVGRTGRGMEKGFALTLCAPEEQRLLDDVEAYLGETIELVVMGRADREATIDFSEDSKNDWRSLIGDD